MARRSPTELGPRDLWDASFGFWRVWVVHLGRRYGLLQALVKSPAPLSPAALARSAEVAAEPTRIWCEAAAGLGLVEETAGKFKLPRRLRAHLADEESPDFMGGHFSYIALRSLDFAAFDELFRHGHRSAREQRHLVEAFAEATTWDHSAFLALVPPALPELRALLRGGADVLDVGCGTGAWCFRVAQAFPRARIRGVDIDPTPLRHARERARSLGLEGRVSFDAGSVESRAYHERFGVIHLGEVLCGARDDLGLLRACRRALLPGGTVVVAEGLIDERAPGHHPENALVRAMALEFALQPARFYTKSQLRALLKAAGFGPARLVAAGGGFYFAAAQTVPVKARRRSTTAPRAREPRSRPPRR